MPILTTADFEAVVDSGIDAAVISAAIAREEAALALRLAGPLDGERTDTLYPAGHSIESQLAEAVLEDARAIVRAQAYRTGRLHDGLAVEAADDEVRVVSTVPYSRFVHDGTVDTEAVPFLRPAATRVASRASELVR
jgi:hypothetical protein